MTAATVDADALDRAFAILSARAHGTVRRHGALAPLTTYRLGGPAGVLVEAASERDLDAVSQAVSETGLDVLVVGRGSNMLVSDEGFAGIALRLGAGFRWTSVEGSRIRAGGGVPLPALASLAAAEGLGGLEFAVAIPASLGGAVRMNAGAHGRSVSDVLETAGVYLISEGRVATVAAGEAGFSYRRSSFPRGSIVVEAAVRLAPADAATIAEGMREAKEWRRSTQPLNLPNAGSVFKNPQGDFAARLIDEHCGKGMRVGGARISEVHANFIVTEPGATASDVHALMARIRRTVRERAGVELEPEVRLVGAFEEVSDEGA